MTAGEQDRGGRGAGASPAVDHVGLSVADLDAAVAWYSRALGWRSAFPFAVEPLGLRGAFVVADDGQAIELLERRGSDGGLRAPDPQAALLTRGYGHICLRVDDTDAWHTRLIAAGATERQAPGDAPEPGVRFSFVADPEGNLIELLDRPGPVGWTPKERWASSDPSRPEDEAAGSPWPGGEPGEPRQNG